MAEAARHATVQSLNPLGMHATRNRRESHSPQASSRPPRSCWSRSSRSAANRTGTFEKNRENGGFRSWLKPVARVQDLTGEASLTDVERTIQKAYQDAGKPAEERVRSKCGVQSATVYPFRVRPATTQLLNLYQATRPRVLGVPNRSSIAGSVRTTSASRRKKGQPLAPSSSDGDAIGLCGKTRCLAVEEGPRRHDRVPDEGQPVKLRQAC